MAGRFAQQWQQAGSSCMPAPSSRGGQKACSTLGTHLPVLFAQLLCGKHVWLLLLLLVHSCRRWRALHAHVSSRRRLV